MNIGDALRRTAREFPKKTAVIDKFGKYAQVNTTYTWGEFKERVNRLANAFSSLGLKKHDRVAIFSDTQSQYFITYQAIVNSGMVMVPLNTAYKGRELSYLLNDSEPRALIVDSDKKDVIDDVQENLPSIEFFIGLGKGHGCTWDFDALIRENSSREPDVVVEEEDLATILYTSGTTGQPKGAMLTHKNWCFSGILCPAEKQILPHYRFLSSLAPFFTGSIGFMTFASFWGFTLVVTDWNTEKVMRIIQEEKINYAMFAPTMTSMIVNHPEVEKYDFSSIERILTSAAPISDSLFRRASELFGKVFIMPFSTTETALCGSILYPEDYELEGAKSKRITSVGKSMVMMNVRVVDEEGKAIPWGSDKIGEVVISGPSVGKGYWKKPEANDLKNGTWYSGDLARVDEDGYIYIVDRKKDMILSGGANVYPREIEEVLYSHPSVLHAAVIGVPNEQWGETVKAIIVLKEGVQATEEEIIDYCRQNLAEYKKPRIVEFRDKLPLSPMGEILKRELREEHWRGRERRV